MNKPTIMKTISFLFTTSSVDTVASEDITDPEPVMRGPSTERLVGTLADSSNATCAALAVTTAAMDCEGESYLAATTTTAAKKALVQRVSYDSCTCAAPSSPTLTRCNRAGRPTDVVLAGEQ